MRQRKSRSTLHERIALVVAATVHAEAHRAHDLVGQLPVLAREVITQRLQQLERGAAAWNCVGGEGTFDPVLGLYRDVGMEYTNRLDDLRQALAGRPV